MLSPYAQIFTIEDGDYTDEREKRRLTIYRCLNTIQHIFDSEFESGSINDYRKQKVDHYTSSLRALNLMIDIFPPEKEANA
jgi:hypothetical protein